MKRDAKLQREEKRTCFKRPERGTIVLPGTSQRLRSLSQYALSSPQFRFQQNLRDSLTLSTSYEETPNGTKSFRV